MNPFKLWPLACGLLVSAFAQPVPPSDERAFVWTTDAQAGVQAIVGEPRPSFPNRSGRPRQVERPEETGRFSSAPWGVGIDVSIRQMQDLGGMS